MAKKEIKPRGVFELTQTLDKINDKINLPAEEPQIEETKKTSIVFFTTLENITSFNKLYSKFMLEVETVNPFFKHQFFRLIILNYVENLKKKDAYKEANAKKLESIISRSGRRAQSINGDKPSKNMLLGKYSDDTLDLFNNVVFSIVSQDPDVNYMDYNKAYFFEILLKYAEKNIDKIIENFD